MSKKEKGKSQVRHVRSIAHTHPARGGVDINDAVLSIYLSTFRPSSVTGSLACTVHGWCCISCATPSLGAGCGAVAIMMGLIRGRGFIGPKWI